MAEIKGNTFLPPVDGKEIGADPTDERPIPAGDIASPGVFNLDYLCPQIAKDHGSVGAG